MSAAGAAPVWKPPWQFGNLNCILRNLKRGLLSKCANSPGMAGKLTLKGHGKDGALRLLLISEGCFELQAEPIGIWEGFLENEKGPIGSTFNMSLERGCILCVEKHRLNFFFYSNLLSQNYQITKRSFLFLRVWFQYKVAQRNLIRSFSFWNELLSKPTHVLLCSRKARGFPK